MVKRTKRTKRTKGRGATSIQRRGKTIQRIEEEGSDAIDGGVRVTFSFGATREVGDHEFVRFDVGLTLPCNAGDEDETYRKATKWVNKRIRILHREVLRVRRGN